MAGMSKIRKVAEAMLPTQFGRFRIIAFANGACEEHVALVKGSVKGASNVLTRLHSQCLTGDTFHSLKCDCGKQLEHSLKLIGKSRKGVFIYLRQEGRGIGLANKIRAYALQDKGMDTAEANLALGFKEDERDYREAAQILKVLGVKTVRLLTNNPGKVKGLEKEGICVCERIPLQIKPTHFNSSYLKTKKAKLHHLIDFGRGV